LFSLNKEPLNQKTGCSLYCNSSTGFKEKRSIPVGSKTVIEEFRVPLIKLDDIKFYVISLSGSIKKKSMLC